jgi:hypothetical protein
MKVITWFYSNSKLIIRVIGDESNVGDVSPEDSSEDESDETDEHDEQVEDSGPGESDEIDEEDELVEDSSEDESDEIDEDDEQVEMVRFLGSFVCHTRTIFMFYLSDKTGCITINKTDLSNNFQNLRV